MFFKIFFGGFEHLKDTLMSKIMKRKMKVCGKNVSLHPSTSVYFGLENLSLGNNVSIPRFSHIFCTEAPLIIGNNVIFGPAPTIVTGDHRIDVIGKPIFSSYDKLPENDAPVIIEDDVWVGLRSILTPGRVVSKGSIVAMGSVLTKDFPEYSIVGGNPAKFIKSRNPVGSNSIIENASCHK